MCQHCDDLLLKAKKIPGDDDHDIWRPHESPYIRSLIETWTNDGLDRFGALRAGAIRWVSGEFYRIYAPGQKRPARTGPMVRWTQEELVARRLYLESMAPEAFTLDDWMLVVDYLFQTYLPADTMIREAQWQIARAAMMGRIQLNVATITATAAARLAGAMPGALSDIARQFGLSATQRAVIEFGQARCAQYVTGLIEDTRAKMKTAIVDWQEQIFQNAPSAIARRDLQGKLLDQFGDLNRDWRRLAITESGEAANQGLVSSLPPGTQVKRIEQYRGACAYCRAIDGNIYTVVAPDKADKDGDTEIWAGKNNYGRSSAPRKRTAEGMVDRLPSEMWWPPAGLMHPNCRGRWIALTDMAALDKRLAYWIKEQKQ